MWLADVANQGGNDVRAVRVRANQKVIETNWIYFCDSYSVFIGLFKMNCGGTWPVFEKPRSENDVASGELSTN